MLQAEAHDAARRTAAIVTELLRLNIGIQRLPQPPHLVTGLEVVAALRVLSQVETYFLIIRVNAEAGEVECADDQGKGNDLERKRQ